MRNIKYFYRFKAIGIDFTSERDIKKHNKELLAFDELSEQFQKMKSAFDNVNNERADITVNTYPMYWGR